LDELLDQDLPEAFVQNDAHVASPGVAALRNEVGENLHLHGIMRSDLTERQRQALQAVVLENVPLDEVAQHWGANRNAMRKLWEDPITWTRFYIISAVHNLPDKDATTQRLLANQTDIGNAIEPFYCEAAGNQLTALLKDHILGTADLLSAAQAGDKAKLDAASQK
jgi:hypothetical protein